MSGPFYGSLAASASVFVAILTALLVNNYVRIKSERRQTENELNRVGEELDALQDRKEKYKDIIDPLIEKRESDYREKAEEQVNEFTDSDTFWELEELNKPIEKLSVDELYQKLLDFHDCDSPQQLEEEPFEYRHRDILENRLDQIEDRILNDIIPSFAADYEGDGWESGLEQAIQEKRETEQDGENTENPEETDTEDPDIEVKAEMGSSDALDLEDFIEDYKQEYGLDHLHEKTIQKLEQQYNEVVDKPPSPDRPTSGVSDLIRPNRHSEPYNSLGLSSGFQQNFAEATMAAEELHSINEPFQGIDFGPNQSVLGLNSREKQKLEEAEQDHRDKEIEIKTLQQRKDRLEREKERLQPEDLNTTLYANVATIVFSVVVPIFAYLGTVSRFTISELACVQTWMIAVSWLLGLFPVFAAIYLRINNDD